MQHSPKVWDWVVVCVHLLNVVPVLSAGAVSVLADAAVAKVLFIPPAVVPLPSPARRPHLPVLAALAVLEALRPFVAPLRVKQTERQ